MAELRARHPVSPPENNQSNAMNYTQNLAHNYNQPVQNFHIQGIHYPQNHNVTSSSSYGAPSRNSGPFGNPVSGNFSVHSLLILFNSNKYKIMLTINDS